MKASTTNQFDAHRDKVDLDNVLITIGWILKCCLYQIICQFLLLLFVYNKSLLHLRVRINKGGNNQTKPKNK